jgi:hypothetical protein
VINFFLCLLFSVSVFAEKSELNRVVFSVSGQAWTSRDRDVYQNVLNTVFQKQMLSQYSKNPENDFLLSRLSSKEAAVFDFKGEPATVTEANRKKLKDFTPEEIEREIALISKTTTFIDIKESQHKDAIRFNAWFDLLKRKYVVRLK